MASWPSLALLSGCGFLLLGGAADDDIAFSLSHGLNDPVGVTMVTQEIDEALLSTREWLRTDLDLETDLIWLSGKVLVLYRRSVVKKKNTSSQS